MTTAITSLPQDSFSRIDTLLARAREATEAKRGTLATARPEPVAPGTQMAADETDLAYGAVMNLLAGPDGDAHRALDPARVARLLDL